MEVGIALATWQKTAEHRRVFIFVDNDAARASMIKMALPSRSIEKCLDTVSEALLKARCFPWFCRVPSALNIADEVSRLRFDRLLAEYAAVWRRTCWDLFL